MQKTCLKLDFEAGILLWTPVLQSLFYPLFQSCPSNLLDICFLQSVSCQFIAFFLVNSKAQYSSHNILGFILLVFLSFLLFFLAITTLKFCFLSFVSFFFMLHRLTVHNYCFLNLTQILSFLIYAYIVISPFLVLFFFLFEIAQQLLQVKGPKFKGY